MMTGEELRTFKEILLNQRSEILNKADAFKDENKFEREVQGDEGDLAVSELTLSLSLRLQERDALLLQKVDRALAKIDEGSFGFCEQCSEPLNIKRLLARPVANLCIACKEEQENSERVFA
jgi:DnaK suppressor protein